jgi:hypothetical protein
LGGFRNKILFNVGIWASWSDSPFGSEIIEKVSFLCSSIKKLSIAVAEVLVTLVGKSTTLHK